MSGQRRTGVASLAEAMSELQIIEAALQQASRRRRWARALRGLWRGLLVGAVLLLVAIGVWHLLPVPSWIVTAAALAPFGDAAGSASALLGTTQFLVGAAAGGLVGLLHNGSAIPMSAVVATTLIGSFVALRAIAEKPSPL